MPLNLKPLVATAVAATMFSASPASALDFIFDFASESGESDFRFKIDNDAAPTDFTEDFTEFSNVRYFGDLSGVGSFVFFVEDIGGGFDVDFDISTLGPQLFSGPTSNPNFLAGTFQLDAGFADLPGPGTLTVTPVPEPATWALMLLGFFAIGGAMRATRQKQTVKVTYA